VLQQFADRGARVILEAPTPMLASIPYWCADWFNHDNPICAQGLTISRSLLEDLRAPILAAYMQIQHAVPSVQAWDPMPTLCPGSECHAYLDGKPILFDGDHLSYFANMLLLPSFTALVVNEDDVRAASR
jgi:hypothetical protein